MYSFRKLFFLLPLLFGCGGGDDGSSISGTGTIEAVTVTLSAKNTGEIAGIMFEEGALVKRGDTVMIVDNTILKLQLRQAEANAKAAEAQLSLLRNGARREDINQAEAALKQARISLELVTKDKERMENLLKAGSITRKQYDDISGGYDISESRYAAAKENLDKLKSFARPEEILQAEARVEQAAAARDLLIKNISDSYIISPIDGTIVNRYFERGETVSPMSSLCKISDLRNLELIIYVPEEELGRIRLGQQADIYTDSYKDKKYSGKVVYISPEAEFTPKNIQTKDERTKLVFGVKLKLENSGLELKAGMPADAVIYLSGS